MRDILDRADSSMQEIKLDRASLSIGTFDLFYTELLFGSDFFP